MTTTETKYSLAQLRATKKSLYIRNNGEFLWKLSALGFELKPKGQPGSIAYLPVTALDHTDVLRNIGSGAVTVSPDLEDELVELQAAPKKSAREQVQLGFLKDVKSIEVQDSPADRSIDAKEKAEGLLDRATQKRVGQSRFTNDLSEFTRPSPVTLGDKVVDPMSGEILNALPTDIDTGIKSVTIERKQKEN